MSLTFAEEQVSDCWDDVLALATQHWAGTQSYRRHEPFRPSRQRYEACNQTGFLILLTARDHARLVGYLALYLTASMHSQLPMAVEDTFFLHPDYRGGRNALRFIRYMERRCQARGIHELLFSCEIDNQSGIHGLLKWLDYQPVIMQYSKALQAAVVERHVHIGADSPTTDVVEVHVGPTPAQI